MALAGHPVVVSAKASSTDPSGDEVDGIRDVEYSPSVDLLDVTDFKDTTGAKLKLAALRDGEVTLNGHLETGDAPQVLLRTSFASGASVWITCSFDPSASSGSKGFKVETLVSNFKIRAAQDGVVEFSCTCSFTGLPAAY